MKSIKTHDELENCIKSNAHVICLFSATWCGPCQKLHPIMEEIRLQTKTLAAGDTTKEKLLENVAWVTVDVDEAENLCAQHKIQSIPHVHFFSNGEKHSNVVSPTREQIVDFVQSLS